MRMEPAEPSALLWGRCPGNVPDLDRRPRTQCRKAGDQAVVSLGNAKAVAVECATRILDVHSALNGWISLTNGGLGLRTTKDTWET
jgi:hypothetical protein